MAKPLSATMVCALDDIQEHGGEIVRYQGGYWSWRDVARRPHDGVPEFSYGTNTIHALVTRGELEYSEWKENRRGKFPIAARVIGSESATGENDVS